MTVFSHRFIGRLAHYTAQVLLKTLRLEVHAHPNLNLEQQAVYGFWHDKQFIPIVSGSQHGNGKHAALVSASKDGDMLSNWLVKLGYHVIRGSSSRKARSGVVKLLAAAKQGYSLSIAVDGPRGPRYEAKAGVAFLAHKARLPLVPLGVAYSRKWHLKKSWDKCQIPIPFSKAIFYLHEPIFIDYLTDLNLISQKIAQAINAADQKAATLLVKGL